MPTARLLLLVGLVLAAIARGQEVAPLPWPENAAQVERAESTGTTLRAYRRRVVRFWDNGKAAFVPAAQPNGFGQVFDLAPHPDGVTFVAAANGLFMIHDGIERSDSVDTRDGVPVGMPYGVHVDDRGVLWLATESGFGTMDTHDFFGRTFTATDGFDKFVRLAGNDDPPAPPFLGLAVQPDGTMVVYTADQAFAYVPGRLRKPELQILKVAGKPFEDGHVYHVGASVPLQVHVAVDGHATLRYRLPNDISWHPLDDQRPVVRGVPVDAHQIEVVAFDRELQSSDPVQIELAVTPPLKERPKVVAAGVTGLELLAGGVLWLLVRRRKLMLMPALVVGVLTLATGVQVAFAMLDYATEPRLESFWVAHGRDARDGVVYRLAVHALEADGSSRGLPLSWIGWDHRAHRHRVISMLREGPPAQEQFLQRLQSDDPNVVGFEVVSRRWRLTPKGPVEVAPVLLARRVAGT